MFPDIVLFGKHIPIYSIAWLLGVFVVGFVACKIAKKNQYDENDMIATLLICGVGVLFGGHILYGLVNYELIAYTFVHLPEITGFSVFVNRCIQIFGGSVFYGGLFGGILAGCIYLKNKNMNITDYSYMIAPLIPLFHFFGRIGCFLGGCCFGVESKIGFTYHYSPIEVANGVSRFPIQLVEAGLNLILFVVLLKLQQYSKWRKYLLYIYLVAYAIIRFVLEFWRGDDLRGVFYGVSTSQFISILIIVVVLVVCFIRSKKNNIE